MQRLNPCRLTLVPPDETAAVTDALWARLRREAQEAYERLRRGRTRKVQYASISTADVLHLPDGPAAQERNARLGARDSMLHHLDWIHDFDALAQEPSERQGGTWL